MIEASKPLSKLCSNVNPEYSERILHNMHGSCLVFGHALGLLLTIVLPRRYTSDHAKQQLLSERIGRAMLLSVADLFSPKLAAGYTVEFIPWAISRIEPKLRIFCRSANPIEISWTSSPDQVADKMKALGALNTTRVAFICHGFLDNTRSGWMYAMKRAMLKQEDMTVVIVEWGNGSILGIERFGQAVRNIETVAQWISSICKAIRQQEPQIYLWGIGHSLGAHLIGLVGKYSQLLDRITGLDPAGPYFEKEHNPNCLSPTDAKIVDVIHTDGYSRPGVLQSIVNPYNHLGTLIPMGTIDFYPNWGHSQPGCENWSVVGNHCRAYDLFIQSISRAGKYKTGLKLKETPTFMIITQDTYLDEEAEMGFHCTGGRGNYFIESNEESVLAPMIFGVF